MPLLPFSAVQSLFCFKYLFHQQNNGRPFLRTDQVLILVVAVVMTAACAKVPPSVSRLNKFAIHLRLCY